MNGEQLKTFEMDAIAPFYPGVDESKLANVKLRLPEGRKLTTKQHRRHTAMLNRVSKAAQQIGALPARGESLHCVLDGSFALWDFVPGSVELTGEPIAALTVATLGFSKANIEALGQLVDAGQIRQVAILCSHYFSAADSEIYQQAVELCAKHRFPLAAMRSHAKLLLMAIGERRLVVESSANLRSCHNCEQATMYDDAALFEFHRGWIHKLLQEAT